MLVQQIEQVNKDKGGGCYFVERVVLALFLWTLKRDSRDQTNSRVFWDKRKAHPSNPKKDCGKTLGELV
jgi:hypothetical protein